MFSTKNYFSTVSGNVFNTNNSFLTKSGNGSDNEFNDNSDYNILNDLMSKRSISPVSSELENSYQILGKLTSHYKSNNNNLNKTQYSNLSQSNRNLFDQNTSEKEKINNNHKEVIFENIKNKDKEIKELFNTNNVKCSQIEEEGEEEDNEEDKYDTELLEYLEENGYFIILKKLENFDLSQKQLINLNDENLIELIEAKNKPNFKDLRNFLMKLDESNDVKDIFNSIDKSNIFDD